MPKKYLEHFITKIMDMARHVKNWIVHFCSASSWIPRTIIFKDQFREGTARKTMEEYRLLDYRYISIHHPLSMSLSSYINSVIRRFLNWQWYFYKFMKCPFILLMITALLSILICNSIIKDLKLLIYFIKWSVCLWFMLYDALTWK